MMAVRQFPRSLLFPLVCITGLAAGAEPSWNVSNSGQPSGEVRLSLTEGTWMSVDVSPDGQTLAFDLLGDIYLLPASGGEARAIQRGPAMTRMPRFSPDGSKLLFLSDASGSDNVWVANADGSAPRQLSFETENVLTAPFWGPDSETFGATWLSSQYADLFKSEIRLYHPGGGAGQLLVNSPSEAENVHEGRLSPDGRHFYYTRKKPNPQGTYSIFKDANHILHGIRQRDLQSGEDHEILAGFGGATTAEISPDGKKLAFVRRVQDKTVLFVYDINTREQRPVFGELDRDMQGEWIPQGNYYPPYSWFPNGRDIAIWGKGKLYRVDTQTASATEIPFHAEVEMSITEVARFPYQLEPAEFTVKAIQHPALSPDGQALVFTALGHVWLKRSPSARPERLTSTTALEYEPAFAPDGKSVAFIQWDDEQGSALQVISLGDRNSRTVVRSPAVLRQPAFSPDGKTLTYQLEEGNKCMAGFHPGQGIYTVAVAGGEPRLVTAKGAAPRFSPDGQRIWFVTDDYEQDSRVSRLASVDLEGRNRREHAFARGSDRHQLTVSPNLRWIGFKENQQYYRMPLVDFGSPMEVSTASTAVPVTRLTELGGYGLTWAPDSGRIAWLLGDEWFTADLDRNTRSSAIGLIAHSDIPEGTVAFVGARLVTMAGEPIERGTLVVKGNRITAIGTAEEVQIPPDSTVIDSHGKTIMPGLVNMHGHLEDCYYAASGAMPQKDPSLYASLAFGVTTNFDPYASELPSYAASEMQRAGARVGPRTISVGHVLFGRPGKYDPVYEPIHSLADAQKVMARKRALGGHMVKSYRQPLRSQRQQIVRAAREAGLMAAIEGESHFYNNISAVLDGQNSLEHNLPVANYYNDIVQLFAHSRTAHTPTLVATFGELLGENYIHQEYRTWEDPRIGSFVPLVNSGYSPIGQKYSAPLYARGLTSLHAQDEIWDLGFRALARSYKKLDEAGVLVNVGSHGQVQGLSVHWEMELLSEGGMSNLRILNAATLNGAKTLAVDHEIGSLEVGKLADLIVLQSNPLEDIHHTTSVIQTMVGGRLYDSHSMDEIGNYDRPRSRFYWELQDDKGTGWNEAAARE